MERSPLALQEAVEAIDPEHSFCLQPHVVDGVKRTECNWALIYMLAVLGLRVPHALANDLHDWFAGDGGKKAGWFPLDVESARQRAEVGFPTVAVWKNPTAGPGHCALVVPAPDDGEGHLYVAAAGAHNTNCDRCENQFGLSIHPDFFSHD